MGRDNAATVRKRAATESFAAADVQSANEAIDAAGRFLFAAGSLSASRAFVGAIRIPENRLAIARSSLQDGDDSIVVGLNGRLQQYDRPSDLEDIAALAVALFNARPDATVAILTQSPNLTAFAVAQQPLPIVYGSGLLKRTPVALPVTHWLPGQSVTSFEATLRDQPLASAALLANHGFIAWGAESIEKLARFVISLEESASITINARALGGAKPLPAGAYEAMQLSGTSE